MIDICPLCGRYNLSPEYPPKPCPICEEDLVNKPIGAAPLHLPHPPQQRLIPEQRPDA